MGRNKRHKRHRVPHNRYKRKRIVTCPLLEDKLSTGSYQYIIGLDEVGWGCIAGPLVVGAVVVPVDAKNPGIKDSKRYRTGKSRAIGLSVVNKWALDQCVCFKLPHVVAASPQETLLCAYYKVVSTLLKKYPNSLVVLDGINKVPKIGTAQISVPKADDTIAAVSAASILAKVTRDNYMCNLAKDHPEYGWDTNKGYGTVEHLNALKCFGVTQHHRLNTAPVKAILELKRR